MDDRKFLQKIRKIQESGKKISLTETVVYGNKKLLKEDEIQTLQADEQREEENKFKDIVSKLVKFNPIKVHKENVEWSGHLIREKIDWYFSLDDTVGCYIDTTDLIQLRDETLEVLKKLRGYYDVWSDEWGGRLTGSESKEGDMGTEGGEMGTEGGEASTGGESGFGF